MYRTYKNLYRIRPAITSIGQGKHRIRLPKGFQITLDMFVITVILWLPMSIVGGIPLTGMVPLPAPLIGFLLAGAVAMKLEKLDPSGKTIVSFLIDVLKFIFRSKTVDGFENQRKMKTFKISSEIPVGLLEDNHVGSLPAYGNVTDFSLNGEYNVNVDKEGNVSVGYKSSKKSVKLPKGQYAVRNNEIFKRKENPQGL
jgi:TcpE family